MLTSTRAHAHIQTADINIKITNQRVGFYEKFPPGLFFVDWGGVGRGFGGSVCTSCGGWDFAHFFQAKGPGFGPLLKKKKKKKKPSSLFLLEIRLPESSCTYIKVGFDCRFLCGQLPQ